MDAHVQDGLLADLVDLLVDVFLHFRDDFLDSRRVDSSVLDELVHGPSGDFTTDGIEATDDHDAGCVVDNHVHAGGFLECADIAALAPDDAALHLVAGNGDCRDGRVAGVTGGVSLYAGGQDHPRLALGVFLGVFDDSPDQGAGLVLDLVFELVKQQLLCVLHGEAGEFEQLLLFLEQRLIDLLFLDAHHVFAIDEFLLPGIE